MKNVFTLLCLLFLSLTAQATVLTLNNNNPTPGQYTTFAAAHNAASAGDTILVHGSPTSYDAIIISKKLIIIGPGHKPNTPSGQGARFGFIAIADNITGIKIYGLKVQCIAAGFSSSPLKNVDSLHIENVFFESGFQQVAIYAGDNCDFLVIRSSVFDNVMISLAGSNINDVIIENNYITRAPSSLTSLISWGGTGNKIVRNNIFAGASGVVGDVIRNTIFENNIFYGVTPNFGTQTDCLYANNITYLTSNDQLPPAGQAGSNNLPGVNPLFVNPFVPPAPGNFDYTRDYRLQPGSPAIGAGTFGTDIGMYEPDFTFSKTGEPARPQATAVLPNPVSVPVNGTTNVNFTIRKSTTETN
jgi:hypothetical protein